jgi:hypothetical protein
LSIFIYLFFFSFPFFLEPDDTASLNQLLADFPKLQGVSDDVPISSTTSTTSKNNNNADGGGGGGDKGKLPSLHNNSSTSSLGNQDSHLPPSGAAPPGPSVLSHHSKTDSLPSFHRHSLTLQPQSPPADDGINLPFTTHHKIGPNLSTVSYTANAPNPLPSLHAFQIDNILHHPFRNNNFLSGTGQQQNNGMLDKKIKGKKGEKKDFS